MPQSLAEFTKRVLPYVPGCPGFIAEDAVLEAAIEFCERSWVFEQALAAINVVNGTGTYPLTPPVSTVIVEVRSVRYGAGEDSEPLAPTSRAILDAEKPDWESVPDTPIGYFSDHGRTQVTLGPTPDEEITGGLVVRVALRPARGVTAIDDFLSFQHHQAMVDGALAQIFAISKQAWTSSSKSAKRREAFDLAIAAASTARAQGHVSAPLRTVSYYGIG